MKKELIAAAILLLLFCGSLVNIRYMDKLSEGLIAQVESAQSLANKGDFQRAEIEAKCAIDRWSACDGYTHIFIRHPEIDSATDAFYELLSSLASQDAKECEGAFEKVKAHLESIAGMEHITLGSIL